MAAKRKAPARKKSTPKRASSSPVVLVTGASGFLGKHLVDELAGARLRALVRSPSLHLERAGVEVMLGDVTDPDACARAVQGVGGVYHLAGMVSRDADDATRMYELHVDGTRALLAACEAAGVARVVVASTSGTVAVSKVADEVSTEQSPYRHAIVSRWPYYLSKIYQEQVALEFAKRGRIEVVIVNPSLLLGPGDDRGSSIGDVEKVVRGRLPIVPAGGGVAFVDARDAAAGCVLAMEKGQSGERYLLSAANMTLETFLGRVARLAQVAAPRAAMAPKTMELAGRFVEALFKRVGRTPPIELQSIEMAEHTWYCDASKAKQDLGWEPRDPQETLADTVRFVQRRLNLGPMERIES